MKQSAAILALFLGQTSAVQLRQMGDDKKDAPLPPEKVHNLLPTHSQDLSNNLDSDYPTFPQPVGLGAGRTAFYAQTRNPGLGDNAPRTDIPSVAGPAQIGEHYIGESVHNSAIEGGDATPNRRNVIGDHPASFTPPSLNKKPAKGSLAELGAEIESTIDKKDPISEEDYDPWVFEFSRDNMPALDRSVNRTDQAAEYGWHPSNQAPNPRGFGNYGSNSLSQHKHKHHHKHHHKAKDIGDNGIVEEVHGFASADKSVLPQPWRRAKEAYPVNGFKNPSFQWLDKKSLVEKKHKHHKKHHHKAKDIGDNGIVEEVHGFASADKSVLPQPWRRAKEAYPVNGFKNPSFQWLDKKSLVEKKHKHHHKHHHKAQDIGDNGIVEEVHGFASNDKSVLPQPWRRAKEAYPRNGFKNPSFQWLTLAEAEQAKRDIGDNGIVEEVHGFASNDKSVLPQPWRRVKEPYPINGFKNPSWQWLDKDEKASLAQKTDIGDKKIEERVVGFINADNSMHPTPYPREEHANNGTLNPDFQHLSQKTDIGDKKIEERVHGFINADNSMHPTPYPREEHAINGTLNPTFQHLAEKDKADIGDKKIREEVHGFVNADNSMHPTPYPREEHSINGVLNPTFQHLPQKQDIGNSKYVRPDVYHFVNENIGQVPTYRRKTAPEHDYEPGKSGQGIDIVSTGPSSAAAAKKASLAQVQGEGEGEGEAKAPPAAPAPEKVTVLQPLEYQHRANTNIPNLRTTFYAQKQE